MTLSALHVFIEQENVRRRFLSDVIDWWQLFGPSNIDTKTQTLEASESRRERESTTLGQLKCPLFTFMAAFCFRY